ncbi:IS1 family transposase [Thiocystis violacea]|uniref:IS1 family transposase n=1 Tax=Thiocystis violacea TaxID=13725 RepID=UPI003B834204
MAEVSVRCPHCHSEKVTKRGKTDRGKPRYSCNHESCSTSTFILDYSYQGHLPEVKKKIVDRALNGSGIRDTARVLNVSQTTVIKEIKKESSLRSINEAALKKLIHSEISVEIHKVEPVDSELDEMWSDVQNKKHPRWLWHAIDHQTGTVLAYVFGQRKDAVFLSLKALLEPFGITRFYTDAWGAYQRHLPAQQQVVGKSNTQRIERQHLTLRTRIKRLARKTICFSKLETMHDIVIGLFINRYDFGRSV